MCVLIWILKLGACTQGRHHWLHLCAFSQVCVILCFCNLCACAYPITLVKLVWLLDQIWPEIGIFGHFGPGLAGSFGALLVGWLVVVARGLYLARHLFTLLYRTNTTRISLSDFSRILAASSSLSTKQSLVWSAPKSSKSKNYSSL